MEIECGDFFNNCLLRDSVLILLSSIHSKNILLAKILFNLEENDFD